MAEYTYDHAKHLEMVQRVIDRMAQNSFYLKGWSVTIVAAVFILVARTNNYGWLWIALLPCLSFWWLDSFFLKMERLYKALFDSVRLGTNEDGPYSMNVTSFAAIAGSQFQVAWSKTLRIFHGGLLLLVVVAIAIC